jgi:nitrous oxidase accessory protein NosD
MKRIGSFLCASVLLVAAGFAPAQAETVNCTAITSLPYTISTQGVYCLTGHLNTGITTGNAITINTNNVVLDLNGFKIGGLSAGLGTAANGIYAYRRQNITVKNGTVRGFIIGVFIEDGDPLVSAGHVIEDIRADQNTTGGIAVLGKGNTIRNNMVVATGGTTRTDFDRPIFGIAAVDAGARVLNNDVTEVTASGIYAALGIYMEDASNSVVAGNRIGTITGLTVQVAGIVVTGESNDVLISDNHISGALNGIFFDSASSSTGKYMNNLTMGVTTPYTGGTPAGTTNY